MIEKHLQKLEAVNEVHKQEGLAIFKAFGGVLYNLDQLAFAVLDRSMALTSAFVTLMRADNFVAAATLIRPQLDNFLRFGAAWLVPNCHAFALSILGGTKVRDMKTVDGKRMTDRFLVDHFNKEHPWIRRVYEATSGYVHLSEKHMFTNLTDLDHEKHRATFKISPTCPHLPVERKIEAIEAFTEITTLVLHRAYSWRLTKENPRGKPGESQLPLA